VYTRAVEAHLRRASRHGLTHRPATPVEVGMLLVQKVDELTNVAKGILDVMRYNVSTPECACRFGPANIAMLIRPFSHR